MKNLTEFKKSLIICVSCVVLVLASYALLPGYSGAIPGGMQTFCTVLVVAFALACVYRVYNDGVDSWPTWAVFITTILIVIIQLGYKAEAKANPFPSHSSAYYRPNVPIDLCGGGFASLYYGDIGNHSWYYVNKRGYMRLAKGYGQIY